MSCMPAVRIEWKSRSEEGERQEIRAERVGDTWTFSVRPGRHDVWQPWAEPPLSEWAELLDGIRRRIGRKLLKPDEEARVVKAIRERFPDARP